MIWHRIPRYVSCQPAKDTKMTPQGSFVRSMDMYTIGDQLISISLRRTAMKGCCAVLRPTWQTELGLRRLHYHTYSYRAAVGTSGAADAAQHIIRDETKSGHWFLGPPADSSLFLWGRWYMVKPAAGDARCGDITFVAVPECRECPKLVSVYTLNEHLLRWPFNATAVLLKFLSLILSIAPMLSTFLMLFFP